MVFSLDPVIFTGREPKKVVELNFHFSWTSYHLCFRFWNFVIYIKLITKNVLLLEGDDLCSGFRVPVLGCSKYVFVGIDAGEHICWSVLSIDGLTGRN
jgi:hypothetical protein